MLVLLNFKNAPFACILFKQAQAENFGPGTSPDWAPRIAWVRQVRVSKATSRAGRDANGFNPVCKCALKYLNIAKGSQLSALNYLNLAIKAYFTMDPQNKG